MKGRLVLTAGLLSAVGVSLLVLDAQSGVGTWANVGWQVVGGATGVACCRVLIGRMSCRYRRLPRAAMSFTGSLLFVPWNDLRDFGIDQPVVAAAISFGAVIVVSTLVLRRSSRRQPYEMPTSADLWVVLIPAFALTLCALLVDRLAAALTILVVTTIMLSAAGHSREDALIPVLVPGAFLFLLLWLSPYRTLGLVDGLHQAIATRWLASEETFVGLLMQHPRLGPGRQSPWSSLPPRVARQLAIVAVLVVAGYPGPAIVVLSFGAIGWIGFRRARGAAGLEERVLVAGMTGTLIVPAALHIVGCLVLLNGRSGALPFVSYGPGELALAWTALGFVAAADRSDGSPFFRRRWLTAQLGWRVVPPVDGTAPVRRVLCRTGCDAQVRTAATQARVS
ncbi:MAG: hypothetical protein HOP16_09780 [Acidobacteria bacterium]|nr:hypothetical protein [Acidobacteriota bacterium]